MSEKLDTEGRIISAEDAHELASLENSARDAEEIAREVSDGVADLDEPSEYALNHEASVHDDAADARRLADTALKNYSDESQEDKDASS